MTDTSANPNNSSRAGFSASAHMLSFLGGCISGVLFAQVFGGGWFGILCAYLCILPIYLAALAGGRGPAITATAFSLLAVFLQQGGMAAAIFALMFAVPAMVVGRVSLIRLQGNWVDGGIVLQTLLVIGSLLVLFAAMMVSTHEGGLAASLAKVAESYVDVFQQMNPEMTPEQAQQMTEVFTRALPSIIICSWFFVQLVNLGIAQWVANEIGKAQRPVIKASALELPNYISVAFVLFALAPYVTDSNVGMVTGTIAVLLGVGMALVGLAILHLMIDGFMRRRNWNRALRVAVFVFYYLVMMVVQVPLFLALALGLADPWLKFRNKLNLSV
ncbi:MAG: DUF2232 domain-containing protein [Bdellovibrionales bacterium]